MAADPIAHNIRRIAHLDLMGAGQVTVEGDFAYVGHITNKDGLGTTILDVSDAKNPRVVSTIMLDDPDSHSHKARVAGDIMVVNAERNNSGIGRKAEQLPGMRERLRGLLGRDPNWPTGSASRRSTSRFSKRPRRTRTTRAGSRSTTSRTRPGLS